MSFALWRTFELDVGIALQALRLGESMLRTPVARRLEGGHEGRVTASALRLGHGMLDAPVLVGAGLGVGGGDRCVRSR